MENVNWYGKPYYSLSAFLKNEYGGRCQKVAIDAGFTCPNRDGTLGNRGCLFCSEGGSGDFAAGLTVLDELEKKLSVDSSLGNKQEFAVESCRGNKQEPIGYIAYFQAFTNTYGPVEHLREVYENALRRDFVLGISIGTRPDCLDEPVIALLQELKKAYPDKFIWVELGLQTIHEKTATYIRRGYPLSVFDQAAERLKEAEIPYIVHIIIGLPGETEEMLYETIEYVDRKKPFGIKLQLLHVMEHTDLAEEYRAGKFDVLSMEEYIHLVIGCVRRLSPEVVLHRVTGDGDKNILIAPDWSGHKMTVLNALHHAFKVQDAMQGDLIP